MKRNLRYFLIVSIIILLFTSCGEDYLEVSDPTVLSEDVFPNSVDDLDPILTDLYGRLYRSYFSSGVFNKIVLFSHSNDHGYNGAEFNESALNNLNADMAFLNTLWSESYLAIGKCNSFLSTIEKMKTEESISASDIERIDIMQGQTKFLRALNYFYLINSFGEKPILSEADKNTLGIPLWTEVSSEINGTAKPRETQGTIYDQIITDLTDASNLLSGVVFDEKSRVDEWAVKSLLGKVYVFTLQWDKAKTTLKEVIDNSGKALVSYDFLRNEMFHGLGEFNNESIFEVNFTPDPLASWGSPSTGSIYPIFISVTYVNDDNSESTNGFGNLFIHDETMKRYGFNDTTTVTQKRPDYIAKSLQVRRDKSVDPRLYVSTYQPYVDSIYFEGQWRMVGKSRLESY
ncbi:MAG: RagB/SusD family nutrient uptake outer membrane protein, partial [Draconibacterium sp.]